MNGENKKIFNQDQIHIFKTPSELKMRKKLRLQFEMLKVKQIASETCFFATVKLQNRFIFMFAKEFTLWPDEEKLHEVLVDCLGLLL